MRTLGKHCVTSLLVLSAMVTRTLMAPAHGGIFPGDDGILDHSTLMLTPQTARHHAPDTSWTVGRIDYRRRMMSATYADGISLTGFHGDMAYGGNEEEAKLLHKIARLSKYHARNVDALRKLRASEPVRAWEDQTAVPASHGAADSIQGDEGSPVNDEDPESLDKTRGMCSKRAPPRRSSSTRPTVVRCIALAGTSPHHPSTTVVEPFRSMETSAAAWKRKIRQQQERDMRKKQREEEERSRDRERFLWTIKEGKEFAGVISRSNQMMERRRAKIIEVEKTEEEARRNRGFKAQPVHITDDDWRAIQERQAIRRKQRAAARKAQMASSSHLPNRMAMHARQQKATAELAEKKAAAHSSRADGRCIPPSRIREVLARKQRRWDQQLAAAKQRKRPVVPETFPMEEREKLYKLRREERLQRNQEEAATARRCEEEKSCRKRERALSAPAPVMPRTTHSFLLAAAKVRATLESKRYEVKRGAEEDARRRARLQATGKFLAEVLRKMDCERGTGPRRDTTHDLERRARDSREKYRRALKENRTKLEQATAHRPTLWERHDAAMRKEAAKRRALSTIAERTFGAGSADAERDSWHRGIAAIQNIFDEEERVVLGLCSQ